MHVASKLSITLQEIDRCLPQTQCTLCGYPRCLDYADAIHKGTADINRCPPGGHATIQALGRLIKSGSDTLADDCSPFTGRKVASIKEEICIGCTLCIDPCPLDAIIGAAKHMHTVIIDNCSGCGLCLDHCPVDCIEMADVAAGYSGRIWNEYSDDEVSHWRTLANRHFERIENENKSSALAELPEDIRTQIRDAVNRERTRRWKKSKRTAARLERKQQSK